MKERKTCSILCAALMLAAALPSVSFALDACRARADRRSGEITVQARRLVGSALWGPTRDDISRSFANADSCVRGNRLAGCRLAAPGSDEARIPPRTCNVWITDESGREPCQARVADCTVLSGVHSELGQIARDLSAGQRSIQGAVNDAASADQADLDSLRSSASAQSASLGSVDQKLNAASGKIDSANGKLDSLAEDVDQLATDARSQNTSLTGVVNSLTSLDAKLNTLTSRVSTVQTNVSDAATNVETLVSDYQGPDGTIYLNQSHVYNGHPLLVGGNGSPLVISQGGKYQLTSNLVIPANQDGIWLRRADNVTIDFNGFALRGPVTGCPDACSATGTRAGIAYNTGPSDNVTLKNGTIEGFDGHGVESLLSENLVLENMVVRGNAGMGVLFYNIGRLKDSQVYDNRLNGLYVQNGPAFVTGSALRNNGQMGIEALNGNIVISECQIVLNDGDGVNADSGVSGSVIKDSVISRNGAYGLRLDGEGAYAGNTINQNAIGPVLGGHEIGTNVCESNTVCP